MGVDFGKYWGDRRGIGTAAVGRHEVWTSCEVVQGRSNNALALALGLGLLVDDVECELV